VCFSVRVAGSLGFFPRGDYCRVLETADCACDCVVVSVCSRVVDK